MDKEISKAIEGYARSNPKGIPKTMKRTPRD